MPSRGLVRFLCTRLPSPSGPHHSDLCQHNCSAKKTSCRNTRRGNNTHASRENKLHRHTHGAPSKSRGHKTSKAQIHQLFPQASTHTLFHLVRRRLVRSTPTTHKYTLIQKADVGSLVSRLARSMPIINTHIKHSPPPSCRPSPPSPRGGPAGRCAPCRPRRRPASRTHRSS